MFKYKLMVLCYSVIPYVREWVENMCHNFVSVPSERLKWMSLIILYPLPYVWDSDETNIFYLLIEYIHNRLKKAFDDCTLPNSIPAADGLPDGNGNPFFCLSFC